MQMCNKNKGGVCAKMWYTHEWERIEVCIGGAVLSGQPIPTCCQNPVMAFGVLSHRCWQSRCGKPCDAVPRPLLRIMSRYETVGRDRRKSVPQWLAGLGVVCRNDFDQENVGASSNRAVIVMQSGAQCHNDCPSREGVVCRSKCQDAESMKL